MILNTRDLQKIQQYLRNVAEVDPDDVIANRASELTVRLEHVKIPFSIETLTETEQALIKYAISKREVYVLHPDARHAVNLELSGIDP